MTLPIFDQSEAEKLARTNSDRESTYCQALLYGEGLQKLKHLICPFSMQIFLCNAFKMSVKFVSNLKKSEFDPRVRGSVFFQISLEFEKV